MIPEEAFSSKVKGYEHPCFLVSTINVIINVIGEEIVRTQKHHIVDFLQKGFHKGLTKILHVQ